MTTDHTKAEPLPPRENRGRNLTRYELETVINFNKQDDMAVVFTYEKLWQRHIEKRMGIQPYILIMVLVENLTRYQKIASENL